MADAHAQSTASAPVRAVATRVEPLADEAPRAAARPIYFGPTRELFGLYSEPMSAPRSGAIVLVYPHGWQYEATHRAYGALAARLCMQGFAVLRFDADGTGDSSGADHDPDRLRAWLASVAHAVTEVKARSGAAHVSLFGVRLGATLAALAAAQVGGVDSLALWAPCVSGKAFVREMTAMRALNPRESVMKGPKVEGGEEAGGFMLSASTCADIRAVNLLKTAVGARRYLILGRDDFPGGDSVALSKALTEGGAQVSYAEGVGYQAMMVDPLYSVMPDEAFRMVVAFFADVHPLRVDASPAEAKVQPAEALLRADASAAPVRESAVRFGGDRHLFGVLTEPAGPPRNGRAAVIFLNTGANPHQGPHRLHVPLARALAKRGLVSLRFDAEGVGDTPARAGVPADPYGVTASDGTRAAIEYMCAAQRVERVVLAGMCSGAYQSFHGAIADERVVGVAMLRPQAFSFEAGEATDVDRLANYAKWRYYVSRAFERDAWAKALRGQARFDVAVSSMTQRAKTVAVERARELVDRLRGAPRDETKVARNFRVILDRGAEVLLVYSREDPGLDTLRVALGASFLPIRARENFHLELMDGSDYTFAAIWSQDRLMEVVERFIADACV